MNLKTYLLDRAARVWDHTPNRIRRAVMRTTHARFMVGAVGLIHDDRGRLLLLEHRFRTPYRWGLPGGFLNAGESLAEGLARELQEEIGLAIEVDPRALDIELNHRGTYVSVAMVARPKEPATDFSVEPSAEILRGGYYAPGELPEGVYPLHAALIERFWASHPPDSPPGMRRRPAGGPEID